MKKENYKVSLDFRLSEEEQHKIEEATTIIYQLMEEMEKHEGDVVLKVDGYGESHVVDFEQLEKALTIFTYFEDAEDGEVVLEATSNV